jgi:hypothetical protein
VTQSTVLPTPCLCHAPAARSHPNIVRLYGYCLEPPTVCLLLELLPSSLKDYLYDTSRLSPFASTARYANSQKARPDGATGFVSTPTASPFRVAGNAELHRDGAEGGGHTGYPTPESPTSSSSMLGGGDAQLLRVPDLTGPNAEGSSTDQRSDPLARRHVTMQRVLELATDVACGLSYLHATPLEREAVPEDGALTELPMDQSVMPVEGASARNARVVHRGALLCGEFCGSCKMLVF